MNLVGAIGFEPTRRGISGKVRDRNEAHTTICTPKNPTPPHIRPKIRPKTERLMQPKTRADAMLKEIKLDTIEIDPNNSMSTAQFIFLGTCEDIRDKRKKGRRYDLIRAAGLLRHLFLDEEPLIHAANRDFRMKITFNDSSLCDEDRKVMDEYLKQTGGSLWLSPDATPNDQPNRQRISLDRFLKTTVVYHTGRTTLTVKDIIDTCAHISGGVHNGKPTRDEHKIIIELDKLMEIDGMEQSLAAIRGICSAALDALTPLIIAIQETAIAQQQTDTSAT